MSWQAYIDSSLVGSGKIDKAAILYPCAAKSAPECWASTGFLNVTSEEVEIIRTGFGDLSFLLFNGFRVDGERYMAIRVDGRSIWGQNGNEAVCVTKTNLAIIVAHNIEGATSTEVATVVEGLAEYIRETGY